MVTELSGWMIVMGLAPALVVGHGVMSWSLVLLAGMLIGGGLILGRLR